MSKIMRTVRWFREMSVLAEDEQRRSGHPEIDVEHLLLGLVSIGGPVTNALAERGVTLPAARESFEQIHARRLSLLGVIRPARDSAQRIPEGSARGGFVYRDGVRKILENASNQPAQDVALFQALLAEPSGHAHEVLRDLGVDPSEVALDATRDTASESTSERSAEYRRFIAAAPDSVWALVSDPSRWLEWNGFEFDSAEITESGIIKTSVRERQVDGRPTRVKPEFRVSEFVVSRFEPPRLIQWERSFPGTGKPATQSLRISITPLRAGVELSMRFIHSGPSSGRKSPMYWLLRPLARLARPFIVRAHLRSKTDNISRALRQEPA